MQIGWIPRGRSAWIIDAAEPVAAALRGLHGTGRVAFAQDGIAQPDDVYFLGGMRRETADIADLASLEAAQSAGVMALFELVKELTRRGWRSHPLRLVIATPRGRNAELHGFASSLAKEYYAWRVVSIEAEAAGAELAAIIAGEPGHPDGRLISYVNGQRHERVLEPVSLASPPQRLRERGVYLIVGGGGEVGRHLTRYLSDHYDARVIWTGRRPGDETAPTYLQADVTDPAAMEGAIRTILARYGALHGVFHSAMVLKDRTIENMDTELLRSVLRPKGQGSLALYNAIHAAGAAEGLDFLAYFSSAQSFLGNPGQSNYAAACTAQDSLAPRLPRGRRSR